MDDNLVLKIGSKVREGAQLAFGEKVDVGDGTSLVPVAMGCYGFGGGSDAKAPDASDVAGGGGGGGFVVPLGAYVTRNGKVTFEPNPVALAAVAIPLTAVTGWAVAQVVKALRG